MADEHIYTKNGIDQSHDKIRLRALDELTAQAEELGLYDALTEIERLRSAGDALVAAIRNHDLSEQVIRAWEEARHG